MRYVPHFDALETRLPLTLVLLADIDTGAIAFSGFWPGDPWGVATVPLGHYLEPGLNFLGSTVVAAANVDMQGAGGHGSMMAAYYAATLKSEFGIDPHIVPLIACSATSYSSIAIGHAEEWVAAQQRDADEAHLDWQWVVTLPAEPGFATLVELQGRAALNAEGVPLIQAAGNDATPVLPFLYDTAPTSLIAAAVGHDAILEAYSDYGPPAIYATVPDAFGTSGATEVVAAWFTAEKICCPWLGSNANIVDQLRHQGLLGD